MERERNKGGTLLKDVITKNYQGLCDGLDCNDSFLTRLYTNGIITQCLMSEVKSLHSNLEKATKVIEFLRDYRTDADFTTFLDILKTSCNSKAFEIITEPTTLPSSAISYGYQGVVAGYIERQELQKEALKHLTTKPNRDTQITFPVLVLHGFGGNGKSQMARRLVQIFQKELSDSEKIHISMWVNATTEASVNEGFRNFANVVKDDNEESNDRNLLLVFDDGDDFEMLKEFLPLDNAETKVKVIITAHSEWVCSDQNVRNIPVFNFTVTEFQDFIKKTVSCPIKDEDIKQLAGYTGRIPAILSIVCKGFSLRFKLDKYYTISKHFSKYRDEIFTFGEDGKLVPGLKESDYKKSVKVVVEQQLACMDNWEYVSPELIHLAKFILNRIAYCDPAGISEMHFFKVHPQILRKANGDYGEIRQAIGFLKEFGWIEVVRFASDKKLEVYSMHACYQIGLKSILDEKTSESILYGMIEYIQANNREFIVFEKRQHQLSFWPNVSSHPNCRALLNFATKTNHCLLGLVVKGLTGDVNSLAGAYLDKGDLVHALLQDEIEQSLFPSSPMFYLFRKATNIELVRYFIFETKIYHDHLEDLEKQAWIRHQLLWATIGAIYSNEYEIFKFTLDNFDLDVNKCLGEYRDTLLHWACFLGNLKFVQLLIEKGVNVNVKNIKGEPAIHDAAVAASSGPDIMKLLIDSGANINEKDFDGETLVQYVILRGNLELIKSLVENGVNINEKNENGSTSLHDAINWSQLEAVKLLIEKGANVNEKDVRGESPLHLAVQKYEPLWEEEDNHLEIVKVLVENGANIYEINDEGDTPLQIAYEFERQDIVDYFISLNQSLHNGREWILFVN